MSHCNNDREEMNMDIEPNNNNTSNSIDGDDDDDDDDDDEELVQMSISKGRDSRRQKAVIDDDDEIIDDYTPNFDCDNNIRSNDIKIDDVDSAFLVDTSDEEDEDVNDDNEEKENDIGVDYYKDETEETLFQLEPKQLQFRLGIDSNKEKITKILNQDRYWFKWFLNNMGAVKVAENSNTDFQQQQQEQNTGSTESDFTTFQLPLTSSYCGVIRPMEWDLSLLNAKPKDYAREAYAIMEQILDIYQNEEYNLTIDWDGEEETQHYWQPILIPWEEDSELHLSPRTLLDCLGANEGIKRNVCSRSWIFNDDKKEDDDDKANDNTDTIRRRKNNKDGVQAIQDFLDLYENSVVFTTTTTSVGDNATKLNPVLRGGPCFAVAHVRNVNLVAGFIGGINI